MSAVCQNFVQNTWKKDMCSNCFKLKQDHSLHVCSPPSPPMDAFNERYAPQVTNVYHSQQASSISTTWKGLALQKHFGTNGYVVNGLIFDDNNYGQIEICNGSSTKVPEDNSSDDDKADIIPVGILKNGQRKASTGSVGFCCEDPQVIGYGGDVEFESAEESEDEEMDDLDDCDSLENFDASEDEKEFSRLTERNTEFNSLHRNLLVAADETSQRRSSAKYSSNETGSSQEAVISKPAEEEQSSANRFQLPRAAIRPFSRESVSSILDAKVNASTPEVHYDENGHVVIKEMNGAPNCQDKECVAYEVSPLSKVVGTDFKGRGNDSPPELPVNPPPDQSEQPLGKSDGFASSVKIKSGHVNVISNVGDPLIPQPDYNSNGGENGMHYSSSAILKGLPQSPQMSSHYSSTAVVQESTNVEKAIKVKPKVPVKPKLSPNLSAEREESNEEKNVAYIDSDSSSQSTSEEIYQDTSDTQKEVMATEAKKELSFQDKVSNLATNLDFNRKSTKRPAPQPPPQLPTENARLVDEKSSTTPAKHEPSSPGVQLAVLLRNPPKKAALLSNTSVSKTDTPEDNDVNGKEQLATEQITEKPSPTPTRKPLSPPVTKKSGIFSSNAKVRTCHSLDISSSKILATPMVDECKENRKFKGKFSFKKFLKFGKDGEDNVRHKSSPYSSATLDKKMKLEIIHPMDLANTPTSTNSEWEPELTYSYEDKSDPGSPVGHTQSWVTRVKPPPPPRTKNGEGTPSQKESGNKPIRPPPPSKSYTYNNKTSSPVQTSPLLKEKNEPNTNDGRVVQDVSPSGGGDVRIVLAPKKPDRNSPGSVRKENVDGDKTVDKNKSLSDPVYYEPEDSAIANAEDEKSETSTIRASSPINKISRHSRQAKAAGMVFMDSGFGETSSGESDVTSVSSGDAHPSTSITPKSDLSHLYAEVIRKAKKASKQRQMMPSEEDDNDEDTTPPPLPPVLQRTGSLSTDGDNASSDNGGGCADRESSPEMITQSFPSVGVNTEVLDYPVSLVKNCNKNLSLRPNRSVIHRNFEENYGAVVTANHEALAQLVEQVSSDENTKKFSVLKEAPLRWSNFKVEATSLAKLNNIVFYNACWGLNLEVTLMVSENIFPIPIPAKAPFLLSPLATFQDFIPSHFSNDITEQIPDQTDKLVHRMIWVFPRTNVQTLPELSRSLRSLGDEDAENFANVVCFLIFQLISCLKHLQSQGIEEVGHPASWMVVMGENDDCVNLRLSLIGGTTQTFPHPDAESYSLCKSALLIMGLLLSGKEESNVCEFISENTSFKNTFQFIAEMLGNEKTTSLSQVKSILEYNLFGPGDLSLDSCTSCKENEVALQRWLDLERATVLNNVIRSKASTNYVMSVFEEFHLLFLVTTNARNLSEAAGMVSCRFSSVA